ncbi:cytochrome P450 [Flavivirga rizhaonensis]|uniref:Cytochrome P450 n=1 Tax=Flavivirga rizhaonensis TaxID=2559571 RepID=A0A4V3P4W8_9FLAO|nr:cytochrome P450 [Flavivirga rizhaonensis]TGV03034.1 cytochrome P450 [Flavivirga rizhaonensis]
MTDNKLIEVNGLKSPKGAFLLGHLPQFNTYNKHQVLERWVEECGELFKIHFVGKQFVVSANPDFNSQMLRLRPEVFKRFSKIDEILKEMGVDGVFNAEGTVWKRHRRPTAEALSVKNIKTYYPIILDKTKGILEKFKNYSQLNTIVNVQKEFMAFTIDITTEIAFGHKLDTINNKSNSFQKHLEVIFPMINSRVTAPIPIWRYFKRKKDKILDESLKSIEKVIYEFINDAKKRIAENPKLKEQPSNFLEVLLVENKDENFTDEEIYGNVFTILLAGEDTTSNSLSWAMFYLAQHPEIVAKVRREAREVYSKDTPDTYENVEDLKYANAVAQEAMRLKPTTPQLYLESNEDVIIDNVSIPKGTSIILQNKVAQTHDDYFSNPNSFVPERWIASECPMQKNHTPNVMRAFGGGPRYCPGMHLAKTEMTVLISTLCKYFDFKLEVKPETIREQFEFTMYPENLKVTFIPAK